MQVQGEAAAPQIAQALRQMNRLRCADVIIVGRGGGSLEDLWPFNEEVVARAVAESSIPVISAVGHETDFTICDFAADLRAPTPSAAAELAVPDRAELLAGVAALETRLRNAASMKLAEAEAMFRPLAESRVLKNPLESVELRRLEIDRLAGMLNDAVSRRQERYKERLASLSGKLNALSPLAVLSRGYAEVRDASGKIVMRTAGVAVNETIAVRMSDGLLRCTVDEKKAGAADE